MKRATRLLTLATLFLLVSSVSAAPLDGDYDLSWWTADGGGNTLSTSDYTLDGAAGQPDAGILAGESYTLAGGFWRSDPIEYRVYLPLVLRNH